MKKITFLALFLMVVSFLIGQNALAIGQMTKPIVIENVLRGQEVQATLNLFNSEKTETTYALIADGQIKDWTTFYATDNLQDAITQIKVPAQGRVDAIAKFKIPNDTPNGIYIGQVVVAEIVGENENKKEGLSVSVGMSVGRDVSITVTDKEIIKFETSIIPLTYGVKRGEPLQIKIIYDNQGNVSVKPDLKLRILKDDQPIFNAIFPYPEGLEPVKLFERKELPSLIEWQTSGRENGMYKAEVTVLLKDEVVKTDSFRFSISDQGLVLGIKNINWKVFWPILIALAVIVLAILTVVLVRKNLKKKPVNSNQ